jgi:hypothetical protein
LRGRRGGGRGKGLAWGRGKPSILVGGEKKKGRRRRLEREGGGELEVKRREGELYFE